MALVLLAAGSGTRVGRGINKVLLPLAGRSLLAWSLDATSTIASIEHTVVVAQDEDREVIDAVLEREAFGRPITVVPGGESRHGSEWHALLELAPLIESGSIDIVVIHDAARPLAGPTLFTDVIDTAVLVGGAIPALEQPGLVRADGTPAEGNLVAVQTPQAFHAAELLAAYRAAAEHHVTGGDTSSTVERFCDLTVGIVPGTARNIKVTYPEDLFLAEVLLERANWILD